MEGSPSTPSVSNNSHRYNMYTHPPSIAESTYTDMSGSSQQFVEADSPVVRRLLSFNYQHDLAIFPAAHKTLTAPPSVHAAHFHARRRVDVRRALAALCRRRLRPAIRRQLRSGSAARWRWRKQHNDFSRPATGCQRNDEASAAGSVAAQARGASVDDRPPAGRAAARQRAAGDCSLWRNDAAAATADV